MPCRTYEAGGLAQSWDLQQQGGSLHSCRLSCASEVLCFVLDTSLTSYSSPTLYSYNEHFPMLVHTPRISGVSGSHAPGVGRSFTYLTLPLPWTYGWCQLLFYK